VVSPSVIETGFEHLLASLDALQPGSFLNGHYAYEPRLAAALRERGIAVVVIGRDPRAALLSMADYLIRRREPRELADRLPSDADAIFEVLIRGNEHVRSLQENFDAYRGWLDVPGTLLVRFEDLVGPNGSGSLGRQAATITQIAGHVGLAASPSVVARAMHGTFDSSSPTFFQGDSERWRRSLSAGVLSLVERHAQAAVETWGAPVVTVEDDRRETAGVLASWMAALAHGEASTDGDIAALRVENVRKQAIIDEWVGRAFEIQEAAWKAIATEHALQSALADNEARLALIHTQQERIAALTGERDRFWQESDERLLIVRRFEALLQQAAAERDRFVQESADRLALIHRQQARIAELVAERDACSEALALTRDAPPE